MKSTAIVLAGGSGSRMKSSIKKQYLDLCGHPILYYSLYAFENSCIDEVILVASPEDVDEVSSTYMNGTFKKLVKVVPGGKERYNSVYNGLVAAAGSDYVFIHDGARPFVNNTIIDECYKCVMKEKACVTAVPSKDTVKISDDNGYADTTPDRRRVWIVQTPQCFEYNLIMDSYSVLIEKEKANELEGIHITDDAMVAEYFGETKVKLVEGEYENIKITTPSDLPMAEILMSQRLEK